METSHFVSHLVDFTSVAGIVGVRLGWGVYSKLKKIQYFRLYLVSILFVQMSILISTF